ncbi:LLM class F420-dependent oxidoreductase [Mycolicibacterium sp. GF69]|uniref:TIGR03560 family F420-dependent LLM class oxidoreductase n=1 Tax=Mycolicibacterium sp. GF69 TaxID=2267251 RepID=UPI000DCBB279|nr:TIGR03560 family F420-dependent LLM class oxidoreductase [Mycolicibacterium sp. GF69]RAV13196.1 LLM class F420-dependent oxidoreductase [Mycolicibacterium sp. GF69]
MQLSVKLAPTFDYPVLERFWRTADELGFPAVWNYDHFYGLVDPTTPTHEGWTSLAAMAVVVRRARVGCLVTGVTYRNPAVLAKMAVTVDHISGGRMDFGIGAGWHETEHRGYGIDFPPPGQRVAMVDEALTVIRQMWTEETVDFTGRFFTLREARCDPKPIQRPHPPIIVGASQPKMLRVAARHADEWNMPNTDPQQWAAASGGLDEACEAESRDPSSIRRGVQLFLHPEQPDQVDTQLESIAEYTRLGCQHIVLSFYQPPDVTLLRRCAELL